MCLISLVIACLVSAQEPLGSNSPGQPAASMESPTLASVPAASPSVTPEELVARAISAAGADEIPGQPLSLLDALSNLRGQAQRMDVVHAYWRATLALAKYGVALDENRQLIELNSATALATGAAKVETCRAAAIDAQRRLARTAGLPESPLLPIPSDRPHVRVYQTRFKEIFSFSVPTGRIRLINRKLPLRLQIIDVRVSAVQAAEDALIALTDSYQRNESDRTTVAAAVEELAQEQREYLEAVCDYNHEIADYALSIAGEEITGRQLVATLIDVDRKRAIEPGRTVSPRRTSDGETDSGPEDISTPEPLPESARSTGPASENEQTGGNHSGPALSDDRSPARLPLVSVERKAFKMPQDDASPRAQYADLTNALPAIQAGQLVVDLFPSPEGTFDDCLLVELRDCLADRSVEDCRDVIDAYWLARLRACEYQAYSSRASQLAKLLPIALDHVSEPTGPADMLRLRATRLSSDADVLEARARLLDAQYELTLAVKRPLDSSWLLPRTSPRCGQYHPLKLDTQPKSLTQSWPLRRLALTIPTLSEVVMSRAGDVVRADAARFDAAGQFAAGTLGVNAAMDEIHKQNRHALAFLDAVTVYNQSLAEYEVRTNSGTAAEICERLLAPVAP